MGASLNLPITLLNTANHIVHIIPCNPLLREGVEIGTVNTTEA